MKKTKYYFTFSAEQTYPFHDGWVEVWALSLNHAIRIFKDTYPDRDDELNCEEYYTQGQFDLTGMKKDGHLGAFCHEVLGEED